MSRGLLCGRRDLSETLDGVLARYLVLRAHGRLRVPVGGELDAVLAGYDRELERGCVLAFLWECDRTVVRVCDAVEARRLPEMGGEGDGLWLLLGIYSGGGLFGEGWRRNVAGALENAVLVVSAYGPGFRWERTLFVPDGRRVMSQVSRRERPCSPEVYIEADRELTLAEILEHDGSVLDLPSTGVVEIDCDDPDAVVRHLRSAATPFTEETGKTGKTGKAKPLDLRINGVSHSVGAWNAPAF